MSKTNVRFYTVDGLSPGVGYTVCFSTIYGEIEHEMEKAMEAGECREVRVFLGIGANVPETE